VTDGQNDDRADDRADDEWNANARHETPTERLDRNWSELLQELRVVQTGVQLLTGFLLTLPFQQQFATLSDGQQGVYLFAVSASIFATGFLQAPVSVHRALFRKHRRKETVLVAHKLAIVGIVFLAFAVVAVTLLIFDVVVGRTGGIVAASVTAVLLLILWLIVPRVAGHRARHPV
jgi:hypothetical protein